jgi:hypothetical protein
MGGCWQITNVPPAAPEAVASARCRNCEFVRGEDRSVRNATLSAASSPFDVAEAMALEAKEGSAALRRASWSALLISGVSCSDKFQVVL